MDGIRVVYDATMSGCVENEMCRAGRLGELEMVRFLLDAGVPINSCDDNGNTLLVSLLSWKCPFSKREKKRQSVKVLLNMGVCVNTVNRYGEWTIHVAVRGCVHGFVAKKTVKRIVAAGSFVGVTNNQGLTPTNIAFNGGLADIGELLLFQGIGQHNPMPMIFPSYVLPTAPSIEYLTKKMSINHLDDDSLTHKKIFQADIFKSILNVHVQPSAPPQDDQLATEISIIERNVVVECAVECDICMDEYQPHTHIFTCFRCRKSLCERCNRNISANTCPFCRADCTKVQFRNLLLEWRVKQVYSSRQKSIE